MTHILSYRKLHHCFSLFSSWQTLGFEKFSLLGWSDGGITALIAAAMYPHLIMKMVVWGTNSFVSEQDLQLYNGDFHQMVLMNR